MNKSIKKIAIIARGLAPGGVRRYVFNILKEFEKSDKDCEFFIIYNQRELFKNKFKNFEKIYLKGKNKLIWDYIKFRIMARKFDFDVFLKLSCKISDKIISVSDFTKKELVKKLFIDKNRIEVVYGAVNEKFESTGNKEVIRKKIKEKFNIDKPFLFYPGSLTSRKNILRLLKAFNNVEKEIPHYLCLTGNKSSVSKKKYIDANLKNKVKILGEVIDKNLIALYNMAELCLYPSLYEGFGLPILEAQACGCPVLTSNITSCPEVAGEGAHLVDPYSIKEIEQGILKIINNNEYKDKLIRKGYKNIDRFSWRKSSEEILKLFNKTLV